MILRKLWHEAGEGPHLRRVAFEVHREEEEHKVGVVALLEGEPTNGGSVGVQAHEGLALVHGERGLRLHNSVLEVQRCCHLCQDLKTDLRIFDAKFRGFT